MKKAQLAFLFLFFIISVVNSQTKAPKLEVPNMTHDFGDLTEGVIVSHSFTIKNIGNDVLTIERVKASCGCTAAQPTKNNLQPGDSTEIKVTFNTNHRSGKQKKYVYVFTDDPENADIRLTFFANIKAKTETGTSSLVPAIRLEKNYHNFGEVQEGSLLTLNLDLKNVGTADLHVKNIKSSCGCTSTFLDTRTLEPGNSGELRIDFDTSDRFGKITRTVTVYSDDPSNPEKTITLFVNILRRDS
ncbi:MAG: DUF1573 domain-containing protein [Bacteroidetes bacterium]|nr:DUF1573 domain-containing protein [Bacteroidota bacterium]